jgi:8-oxo-dGTP pyrophosphatase MutT (NUDIX family)
MPPRGLSGRLLASAPRASCRAPGHPPTQTETPPAPGESLPDCGVREVEEETGIRCEISGLVGVYTNPRHVILYTSNGEVRQECSLVFTARMVGGEPRPSSETLDVRWVPAGEINDYPMHPSMRQRIGHFLERRPTPYVG